MHPYLLYTADFWSYFAEKKIDEGWKKLVKTGIDAHSLKETGRDASRLTSALKPHFDAFFAARGERNGVYQRNKRRSQRKTRG